MLDQSITKTSATIQFKFNINTGKAFEFDYDTGEMCCALCGDNYVVYHDPFIKIIDSESFIEITYELCLNCINSFKKCSSCSRKFNEPWDIVFYNVANKTKNCMCCCNDKRNKHYKKCLIDYCINCSKNNKQNT